MENRIREFRKNRGLTLEQLAEKVGTTFAQIQKLEKGERRLTHEWMQRIAKALGCQPQDLIAENTNIINVPVGGKVAGGKWIEAVNDNSEKTIPFRYSKKNADLIALEVEGQSMNKYAPDGHYIIVDRSIKDSQDGARVVARWDDSVTFKVYRSDPVRLEPDSTEKHDIIFPNGEVHILGHAVGTVKYDKL